jgi:sortase A
MSEKVVWLRRAETALFAAGLILMAAYASATIHGRVAAYLALYEFESAELQGDRDEPARVTRIGSLDVHLWSPQRIREYMESAAGSEPPLAVLRIPKLRLEVPVFDGTDERTLQRGAGRIIGTARLGEVGNTGLAAHRDSFFRGLKDVEAGDILELRIAGGEKRYVVTGAQITTPEDVSVLQPTGYGSLTLVTCYPFYFIGSAPQRYIVHASLLTQESPYSSNEESKRGD